jgi:hypothetical protein
MTFGQSARCIVKAERGKHIDDFLLRRSSLAIRRLVSMGLFEAPGDITRKALGWSKAEPKIEVKRVTDLLTTRRSMNL